MPPSAYLQKTSFARESGYSNFNRQSKYDHRARKVYFGGTKSNTFPTPPSLKIWTGNEETGVQETLFSKASTGNTNVRNFNGIGLAPDVQKLSYYFNDSTSGFELLRMQSLNYDGTGDTQLFVFPSPSNELQQYADNSQLIYDYHKNLFVIGVTHLRFAPNRNTRRLYTFTPGAVAAPTVIYEATDNVGGLESDIFALDYDGINHKIWFLERTGTTTPKTVLVRRCNWDGSNVETILSPPTGSVVFNCELRVSYHDQCLYTWEARGVSSTDLAGGMYQRQFDWTQVKKIINRNQFSLEFITGYDIGCGFEKVGPSYKGHL